MVGGTLSTQAGSVNSKVDRLLSLQDGVISRRQALEAGLVQHDLRRLLRRREWAVVHRGVYVNHTGQPTWHQLAWAAVLLTWPSALCDESALRAAEGPGKHERTVDTIHVAVGRHRTALVAPQGVRVHHRESLDEDVLWNVGPPRLRYEEAALDVAMSTSSHLDAIGALAQACQSRRTTAARLLTSLSRRSRVPRRRWLEAILRDVTEGTCSVLEHGYLTLVERPHSFPVAHRQESAGASVGVVYRDASYGPRLIELDGRLFHDSSTQRDRDIERDLDAAVDGQSTTRLAWGQVFDRPCSTAAKLVVVLRREGVPVNPRGCGPGCQVSALEQTA